MGRPESLGGQTAQKKAEGLSLFGSLDTSRICFERLQPLNNFGD
jgi:hypothetical protein